MAQPDSARSVAQSELDQAIGFPRGNSNERDLLLSWLGYLRAAVRRKIDGLEEEQARWRPGGRLISPLGIVNHLTHVEWRWIDGGTRGEPTSRSELEFQPPPELERTAVIKAYRTRAAATDAYVWSQPSLAQPCLTRGRPRPELGHAAPDRRDRAACWSR